MKEARSAKDRYVQQLPQRYQVNEGRISWDVEADPPIDIDRAIGKEKAGPAAKRGQGGINSLNNHARHVIVDDTLAGKRAGSGRSSSTITSEESAEHEKKPKYR